ncbi:MAG: 2-hydroxyacyl-CoA dehydratase [Lachnospiraceae bacterium]|nr:2-hydroxyacyl-CoA dehydratase [Lachnospiraceae bacterium]
MKIGIDIGSTTIKCVVLDDQGVIIHKSYERHFAMITEKTQEVIRGLIEQFQITEPVVCAISGSAGMGLAERANIPFVQEVYATKVAMNHRLPEADVVIELGGEDAKILFLQGNLEVRMNGTCAGGTGAFADQMASLMQITVDEMNELAKQHEKIYSIASRCGVFAKTDIQPLLNQGARKEDISASIFYAIVNQTITGLAQGHPIEGNIVYLGGPLTFMSELRKSFDRTLNCKGICPEDSLHFVALGAAYYAEDTVDLNQALIKIGEQADFVTESALQPLFRNQEEYEVFTARHKEHQVPRKEGMEYHGDAYLGIDSGSTTLKVILTDSEGSILFSKYQSNQGKPIDVVRDTLVEMYEQYPDVHIVSGAVTGYGEDMIRNALGVDVGVVETVAHFTAAKYFMPDVEFIIDIGGQDMKCFKIRNGAIDNIFLNEACSSGCGSFLQTFASSLGYPIDEFAKLGLFGDNPVDLGSRCTVFMNSSVKQAQKEGVTVENISAGLSISVVKNALYKVIRVHSAEELGKKIVVQGGTFLNDAVLRAFEQEMGVDVIRPDIAGMMGAYGAALYAKQMMEHEKQHQKTTGEQEAAATKDSDILNYEELKEFTYSIKSVTCNGCNNHCQLTVNDFGNGRRFIGGNRCEKPVTNQAQDDSLNLYEYKLKLLAGYEPGHGTRGVIGLPMGLNMYEMYPFWHAFFTSLGYQVKMSGFSNRKLYLKGQGTIPSDTVCFPAKMMHGHIQQLIEMGVDAIFYPCMTYNFDEKKGANHYNCAVIAGYPEVIEANTVNFGNIKYINDYVGPHVKKEFPKRIHQVLEKHLGSFTKAEVKNACEKAYAEYDSYMQKIQEEAQRIIGQAREQKKKIIVLAGRPYHADPEINHGIHKLIAALGFAVISEDAVASLVPKFKVNLLNQWTYHARLFSAAQYVATQPDMYLVHLVSFGCGLDAVTTDEARSILEDAGKLYTQIKIDEVTNLGAVKIRLRSLMAAIEQTEEGTNLHEQ